MSTLFGVLLYIYSGNGPEQPQNLTVDEVIFDPLTKMKLVNLSWDTNNDAENIKYFKITSIDDNRSMQSTIVHPNTTSILMEVPANSTRLQVSVEVLDKCNRTSIAMAVKEFPTGSCDI